MSITKISPSVVDFDDGITISTADNTDTLILTSTDADDNSGPNLNMYRNSSSAADADVLGQVKFTGKNDAGSPEDIVYGSISGKISDASDSTEDGQLRFFTMAAGTSTQTLTLESGNVKIPKYLYLQTTDDQANAWLAYTHTDDTLRFNYNGSGSDEITVSTSGNVTIGDGNLVVASGHGIDFSATSNGSGTSSVSELLDDYEEGTWTPAISSGSCTFSEARYTKIGRLVSFSYQVQGMDDITSNNHILVTGLPFPVQAGEAAGVAFGTFTDNTSANVAYATTSESVYLYAMSSGTWDTMLHSELNSTSNYQYVAGTYQAES